MRGSSELDHELTASEEEQAPVEADGDKATDGCPYHKRAGTGGASPRRARGNHPGEHRYPNLTENGDMCLPVHCVRHNCGVNNRAGDAADCETEHAKNRHKWESNNDDNDCIGD